MNNIAYKMITPGQCKAARSALGWTRHVLAEKSGVHFRTITNFENGIREPINATREALQRTLLEAGVEFQDGRVLVPVHS